MGIPPLIAEQSQDTVRLSPSLHEVCGTSVEGSSWWDLIRRDVLIALLRTYIEGYAFINRRYTIRAPFTGVSQDVSSIKMS